MRSTFKTEYLWSALTCQRFGRSQPVATIVKPAGLRSSIRTLTACAFLLLLVVSSVAQTRSQKLQNPTSGDPVPKILLLRIVRAEDERRWDNDLRSLFHARNANVRARAALAAGRIGNEAAVADLIPLLQKDDEPEVRAMAAFALGEIESPLGADALVAVLNDSRDGRLRARAVEALGKITAALPKEQAARAHELAGVVLDALAFEARRRSAPDTLTILLGLTAVLRAKPDKAGEIVKEFLHYSDPRVRADAANTMARLKLKDGNEDLRKLVVSDPDPIVRANAARALGATEDKQAFEAVLDRALNDDDSRVRVSATRALGSIKDARAAMPLLTRGKQLLAAIQKPRSGDDIPAQANELIEIASTLGKVLPPSNNNTQVVSWLSSLRAAFELTSPEVEIAFASVAPQLYSIAANQSVHPSRFYDPAADPNEIHVYAGKRWQQWSSIAQGLAVLATAKTANPMADASNREMSTKLLRDKLICPANSLKQPIVRPKRGAVVGALCVPLPLLAVPDFLRSYAQFKPGDLAEILRKALTEKDEITRATAAELLGELPPDETNTRALVAALPVAFADKQLNDAALAILEALGKQKSSTANDAVKTALGSTDHLIRRKAVAVLKANDAGDFSSRIGTVQSRNTTADYERALARIGKHFNAVVTTTKGSFTIELLPEEAPLNVDNFIQLAKRGYFNGITVHRVVPNFVIQDGDPRGDGNGGPGYQIRCEINEVPYERGAVGMALSGKDTGGSQWFVTHSPQPHLDGGYTVFGNVVAGMDVVDNIARGDVIRSIAITEARSRKNRDMSAPKAQ